MRGKVLTVAALASYLAGVTIRYLFICRWHPAASYVFDLMETYHRAAKNWFDPAHMPSILDSMQPPGTEYFFGYLLSLDPSYSLIYTVQFVLSSLVPVLAALTGLELFGRRAALVACIMASLYFPFIDCAGYFLPEGPCLFLLLCFFWMSLKSVQSRAASAIVFGALAGLALGLAAAFKSGVLAAGAAVLLVLWILHRKQKLSLVRPLLGAVPAFLIVFTPMAARATALNGGAVCFAAHDAAPAFLLGHYGDVRELQFKDDERGLVFTLVNHSVAQRYSGWPQTQVSAGAYDTAGILRLGAGYIIDHPANALLLSVEHVFDLAFYSLPWPSRNDDDLWIWTEVFHKLFLLFILLPAAAYVWRNRARMRRLEDPGALWASAPLAALMAVAFLSSGDPRDRIPYDVFLMLLAAGFYCAQESSAREPSCSGVLAGESFSAAAPDGRK